MLRRTARAKARRLNQAAAEHKTPAAYYRVVRAERGPWRYRVTETRP